VVLWKYGFRDYIDTYRSRDRRKDEERLHLRRLEEQLLSQDERMADDVKCQVALAMSHQQQQQVAPAEPIVHSVPNATIQHRIVLKTDTKCMTEGA
jgi:hypothetical protein